MKMSFQPRRTALLMLAACILFSLSSGCGAPPEEGNTGVSATGAASVSPSASASLPSPSASQSGTPSPSPAPEFPAEWDDHGIFSASYEKAYKLLQTMTLEEKLGQLLLVRCPQENAEAFIKAYAPGGLVLYESDFHGKTAEEVIAAITAYQKAAKIPMVMAVDEEGGTVVRISGNKNLSDHKFQSPQALYAGGGFDAVREDTLIKAALLKRLGLNLNLAPVADVCVDKRDYIYPRAFGQPAAETGRYVAAVVAAAREAGLSSALKHFPGYNGNADTHQGIAVDDRPSSDFYNSDFIPFKEGIDADAETVLVSHTIVSAMEKDVPASLSPAVHRLLRDMLHFTGVIITDDLSMQAVAEHGGALIAVRAMLAGNDMLLLQDYERAYDTLLEKAQSGVLPPELIDRAVFRILAWKLSNRIISGETADALAG
jgi:beta-N-acetylhexosaminidase